MPPEVTTTACAPSENSPTTRRELLSPRAVHDAVGDLERAYSMSKAELDAARTLVRAHASLEWLEHAGTDAPRDVKARHAVPGCARARRAALRPAHGGKPPQPLRMEP